MSARRCNACSTNWPASLKIGKQIEQFLRCPECGAKTDFFGNADPIEDDEARSRTLHAQFETYYEQRENKRIASELEHIQRGGN